MLADKVAIPDRPHRSSIATEVLQPKGEYSSLAGEVLVRPTIIAHSDDSAHICTRGITALKSERSEW